MTDSTHVVESSPNADTMQLIDLVASEAAEILGVSLSDPPPVILAAVNGCIRDLQQRGGPSLDGGEDIVMLLGSLWGAQVVNGMSWQWANIDINDQEPPFSAIGVVSPSREMVIYPFNFVASCLEKDLPSTILLAYNMLSEKADSLVFEPHAYENVMSHVHHIVPPE
ncbi:hypothetical protein [Bremerella alba]|uniref:Uncharacterized protein n=1 Tax=Bremerella alba TaxID=980252 RepID=A0A7V8V221_9BACT|nr:hypothetical protein [Bremerella alba]MBA2113381.1 hypothetical protein [Bremerella alba]